MPRVIVCYVRWVDAFNRKVGRLVMLLIFVMMGVLLYGSISRSLFNSPLIWASKSPSFSWQPITCWVAPIPCR